MDENFDPIDKNRLQGIKSEAYISEDDTSNLLKESKITIGIENIKSIDKFFISKNPNLLMFPKFKDVEQTNYKCVLIEEYLKFILILQNIKPNYIYLNSSINIEYNIESTIYIPDIKIKKTMPQLIIYPINDSTYENNRIIMRHNSVIIVDTKNKTITYFDSLGGNVNKKTVYILKNILINKFHNYTFINAYNIEMKEEKMDIDFKDYNNYYYNWDNYNSLDIRDFINRKKRKNEIKKIRKQLNKINKQDKKHNLMNIDYILNERKIDIGLQLKQESNEKFDDLGGFCVGWSLYMVFLTFININLNMESDFNISQSVLVTDVLNQKNVEPVILNNMIRQFITYVMAINNKWSFLIKNETKTNKALKIIFNDKNYKIMTYPSINEQF